MMIYYFLIRILVTIFAGKMGILSLDLDKINLDDDNNFYEDDPETIIKEFWLGIINLKNVKHLKKI